MTNLNCPHVDSYRCRLDEGHFAVDFGIHYRRRVNASKLAIRKSWLMQQHHDSEQRITQATSCPWSEKALTSFGHPSKPGHVRSGCSLSQIRVVPRRDIALYRRDSLGHHGMDHGSPDETTSTTTITASSAAATTNGMLVSNNSKSSRNRGGAVTKFKGVQRRRKTTRPLANGERQTDKRD